MSLACGRLTDLKCPQWVESGLAAIRVQGWKVVIAPQAANCSSGGGRLGVRHPAISFRCSRTLTIDHRSSGAMIANLAA